MGKQKSGRDSEEHGLEERKITAGALLVSICCITYNQENYIEDALRGFLSQKVDFPYEILIHDDASTDGTAEIIRDYARRYPEVIKPILRRENQYSKGITNVSMFNFSRAQGEYIAMCEGDDYWTDPDKLKIQVDYMRQHPDCSLCLHSARIRTVDGSSCERQMRPYRADRRIEPEEIVDKTSGYPTASLLFRASLVKELPEYYRNCPVGDIPLQLMAAARGYGWYIDTPMCVYRVGVSGSWTSTGKQGNYEEKQRRYCEQMKETYRAFDCETGGRFHAQAERAAERIFFLTQVNTRNYEQVFDRKYREFYKELSLRTRFFVRMERTFPWLYDALYRAAQLLAKRRK